MNIRQSPALLLALFLSIPCAPALASPTSDPHHVMWTTADGKQKCMNKSSKEKADKCADKIRIKEKASNVQVMSGKCSEM